MLRRLRAGEFIALAVDLNATRGGVFINAWGIPASTPPGPALIALRDDVPVHLMTVHRRPDGHHLVKFFPAFTLIRTGDHAADVRANLQQFTDAFQAEVLRHPDQYYWQYPRWRTRPGGVTMPRSMEFEPSLAAERTGPPFPAPPGW
jgi:KDO2-lipid IV(A) lauroyltransferase